MKLQNLWDGFSEQQYEYITDIIKNSDAESVCELGTFVGTTAKRIWNSIKHTDKKLFLVDNYLFLPQAKRQTFFNYVKKSIDPNTSKIKTVLESSHSYDWGQHDFVFFGHHDADHMLPDLKKLLDSSVSYAIIGDGVAGCFRRTKAIFEFLASETNYGFTPQYYINGLIVIGRKELSCGLPTVKGSLFSQNIRYTQPTKTTYSKAINELKRIS